MNEEVACVHNAGPFQLHCTRQPVCHWHTHLLYTSSFTVTAEHTLVTAGVVIIHWKISTKLGCRRFPANSQWIWTGVYYVCPTWQARGTVIRSRLRLRLLADLLSCNDFTCASLTKQYDVISTRQWCPATGKVTVGMAKPCITDFSGITAYGPNGLCKANDHYDYTPAAACHTFTFYLSG